MSKNKILDSVFKDFLDGKEAHVSSGGVGVCGNHMGVVTLKYDEQTGLNCLGRVSENSQDLIGKLSTIFTAERERLKLSFDSNDNIINLMTQTLENSSAQYGHISSESVAHFETSTDEAGDISKLIITYKSGSKAHITVWKP